MARMKGPQIRLVKTFNRFELVPAKSSQNTKESKRFKLLDPRWHTKQTKHDKNQDIMKQVSIRMCTHAHAHNYACLTPSFSPQIGIIFSTLLAIFPVSKHDVSAVVTESTNMIAPPLPCRHIMLCAAEHHDLGRPVKRPSATQRANSGLLHLSTVAAE